MNPPTVCIHFTTQVHIATEVYNHSTFTSSTPQNIVNIHRFQKSHTIIVHKLCLFLVELMGKAATFVYKLLAKH